MIRIRHFPVKSSHLYGNEFTVPTETKSPDLTIIHASKRISSSRIKMLINEACRISTLALLAV